MWLCPVGGSAQLSSNNHAINETAAQYDILTIAIQGIVDDQDLQGQGYGALKDRIAQNEMLLVRGYREYCLCLGCYYAAHKDSIDARFAGLSFIDTAMVNSQIARLTDQRNKCWQLLTGPFSWARIPGSDIGVFWQISSIEKSIRDLEEKLRLLEEYESVTCSLYDPVIQLGDTLKRGLQYTGSLTWDGSDWVALANSGDTTWRDDLALHTAAACQDIVMLGRTFVYGSACGQYGGDQEGPQKYFIAGSDARQQLTNDVLNKYPGFQNLSDKEIDNLLLNINNKGCGYTALSNAILERYYFREEEFERTFGFPLFRIDAQGNKTLNRELLITDIFCARQDALNVDAANLTLSDGVGPWSKVVGSASPSLTFYEDYLNQHGIQNVTVESHHLTGNEDIAQLTQDGTVVIAGYGGVSYDAIDLDVPKGERHVTLSQDGAHETVITGVDGNGDYIVSSWGNKYTMSGVEDNNDANGHAVISVISWSMF
jgi:hypothetical protein